MKPATMDRQLIRSTGATPAGEFTETQVRIILSAEKLFASASIDSVSMREIASAARQRNHSAVQYHFGSREGLVRAIYRYRMQEMEERRGLMLQQAERDDTLHDARTLIEMVYLPQLDLHDADGRHSYANFLCQYLLRQRPHEFGDFGTPSPPNLDRVLKLLRIRLGFLPTAVAQRRLIGASLVFLNILVRHGQDQAAEEGAPEESIENAIEDTLAQIELALCMPLPPPVAPARR